MPFLPSTLPLPPPPRAPRDWPVWVGVAIGWTLARMPWPLQRVLGRALGAFMRLTFRSRRRVVQQNLALCFPDLDDAQRALLLRENFTAVGIGVFEFARAWWGSVAPMRATVRLQGLEHLRAAQESGRGVILISGHFMTLELCGRLLCDHIELAGMYREHDQPALEWAVKRGRLRYASAMYAREEVRAALRHLKQGGMLWFAPDQDTLRGESVFVPFFGRAASSLTSTHQLARMSGALVLPFAHRREADGSYTLTVKPALAEFPGKDPAADTARVMGEIEAMVRNAPEQYLWMHKRFKRQPEGMPSLY